MLLPFVLAIATAAPPITVTVQVCPPAVDSPECQQKRREWERVKDEVELHNLILEDLKNYNAGELDISLRARITAIARRLAKNQY